MSSCGRVVAVVEARSTAAFHKKALEALMAARTDGQGCKNTGQWEGARYCLHQNNKGYNKMSGNDATKAEIILHDFRLPFRNVFTTVTTTTTQKQQSTVRVCQIPLHSHKMGP